MFVSGRHLTAWRHRSWRAIAAVASVCLLSGLSAGCGANENEKSASIAEIVRRGDEAVAKKDFKSAISAYRTAMEGAQKDGELRLKLASAYRSDRQWSPAIRESIIASDLLPDNREARLLAIEAMLGGSRFEDALDRVTPLMKAAPDDPVLLALFANAKARMLAFTYGVFEVGEGWRNGRHYVGVRTNMRRPPLEADDAVAWTALRKAYAIDPKSYEVRMSLAGFLWAIDRLDDGAGVLKAAADDDPSHAFLSCTMGLYYEFRGRHAEAEKYLRVAAQTQDRDSRLALADFLARVNRPTEALEILEPLAAKDDGEGAAISRAAQVELRLGRHDEALRRAEATLARSPNDPAALRVKAQALLASGDPAKSLAVAKEAVGVAPHSRDAHLALAKALDAVGDLNQAFEEYSNAWRADPRDAAVAKALARVALALGRHGVAVDLANQSLRLQPGDPAAAVIQARGHVRLGDLAGAERALAPFAKEKAASAEILALEGEIQAGRGNAEAARTSFRKALQLDRDSIEALTGLVKLDTKAGQTAGIRSEVEQAAARQPNNPGYQLLIAQIATAENALPRAESALRSILSRDSAHEEAALLFASIMSRQNKATDAQGIIEKALERRPASVALRFSLAGLFERQGMNDKAKAQYERVVTDNQLAGGTTDMLDALHTAYARLATLYANQESNLDEALQLATTAKRYKAGDPRFSDALGWVQVKKQRARLGLPHLQDAARADPANPLIRYHLGVAYDQLGDIAKARQELTEALRLDPAFPGADAARSLLKTFGR